MRESRSAVLAYYARAAVRHSGLTERAFAMRVVELYEERTPAAHRRVPFSTSADPFDRERANAQTLHRFLFADEGAANSYRLPDDLEEACVLALPDAFRRECLRELCERYGLLAATATPPREDARFRSVACLLRETAEAVEAMPAVVGADAVTPGAIDKALRELLDVEAAAASLRAWLEEQRASLNVVSLRRA